MAHNSFHRARGILSLILSHLLYFDRNVVAERNAQVAVMMFRPSKWHLNRPNHIILLGGGWGWGERCRHTGGRNINQSGEKKKTAVLAWSFPAFCCLFALEGNRYTFGKAVEQSYVCECWLDYIKEYFNICSDRHSEMDKQNEFLTFVLFRLANNLQQHCCNEWGLLPSRRFYGMAS